MFASELAAVSGKQALLSHSLRILLYDRYEAAYTMQSQADESRQRKHIGSRKFSLTDLLSADSISNARSGRKVIKFPKDLLKYLHEALRKIVMGLDSTQSEAHLRNSFAAFFNYYLDGAFQKTIKDSRRIEDLLLMFYSRAIGELQKHIAAEDVQDTALQHVAMFVRLLTRTLREHKLCSPDSDLIQRLLDYETKLRLQGDSLTAPSELSKPPVFTISECEKDLLSISALLKISVDEVEVLAKQLWSCCSPQQKAADVKNMLASITADQGLLRRLDFHNPIFYEQWKTRELSYHQSLLVALIQKFPGIVHSQSDTRQDQALLSVKETELLHEKHSSHLQASQASTFSQQEYFFIPSDSGSLYEDLLQSYSETFISYHRNLRLQNEPQDIDLDFVHHLVVKCKNQWRIPDIEHRRLILTLGHEAFSKGEINLPVLDSLLLQCEEDVPGYYEGEDGLTIKQCDLYVRHLYDLCETILRELYSQLCGYASGTTSLDALAFLDRHILDDVQYASIASKTNRIVNEIEESIQAFLLESTRSDLDRIDKSPMLETHDIKEIQMTLKQHMKRLKKASVHPLIAQLHLLHPYINCIIPCIIRSMSSWLNRCETTAALYQQQISLSDAFELYRGSVELLECLGQSSPNYQNLLKFIEEAFEPYVFRWLDQAEAAVPEVIHNALSQDRFDQSAEHETDEPHSLSVIILFRVLNQHLGFLQELEWNNQANAAQYHLRLFALASQVVQQYCETLQSLFENDLQPHIVKTTLGKSDAQRGLMNKARRTLSNIESPSPLQIPSSACIRLNNIQWAKLQWQSFAQRVRPAVLDTPIEQPQSSRNVWSEGTKAFFTVTIVAAQNLLSCDPNGFSDPYVVLSDQSGKRLAKTKTIYTDLHPSWNESFELLTDRILWLAFTVWDRDEGGEHDICGRCSMKLDPRSYTSGQDCEYNLELDTMGHLQVKVSALIDTGSFNFYTERAGQRILRIESGMIQAIVERLTPFVSASLNRARLKLAAGLDSEALGKHLHSALNLLKRVKIGPHSADKNQPLEESSPIGEQTLQMLLDYLDVNLQVLDSSLSRQAFLLVTVKLWEFVVLSLSNVIIPLVSPQAKVNKRCHLTKTEFDVVYTWLALLRDTFEGEGGGLSDEVLDTKDYKILMEVKQLYLQASTELVRQYHTPDAIALIAQSVKPLPTSQQQTITPEITIAEKREIILKILALRSDQVSQDFMRRVQRFGKSQHTK